ncbi:MAG: hypothetical protein R2736_10435 [Solirubrobacterales bacterium]
MLALLDRPPPTVLADQHEQEGGRFFFPPNADPIHHEVSGRRAGRSPASSPRALRRADRAGRAYASYGSYDLFFMGYADAATTTPFGAADDLRAGWRRTVREGSPATRWRPRRP